MRNVRVDENGDFRCWKCGGKHFTHKRTGASKLVGFAALATKKKLKCQGCGRYNNVGNAKPFRTPTPATETVQSADRPAAWLADPTGHRELRYWDGTAWTEHVATGGNQSTDPLPTQAEHSTIDVADQLRKLAQLRDDGLLTAEEFAQQKAKLLA
jgi:hypothetical protein